MIVPLPDNRRAGCRSAEFQSQRSIEPGPKRHVIGQGVGCSKISFCDAELELPHRDSSRSRQHATEPSTSGSIDRRAPFSNGITGELMAKRAKKKKKSTARRTSRPQKKLSDLFHETLKDIYFTENKIIKTLPKMAKAAQSKELAAAFNKHLRETQGQVKRLDQVFRIIGKPARGKPCEAINGIADEGAEIMKEFRGMPALDAGLVAAAQAVEHYEISRYGTLRTWAEQLGMSDAANLLQQTLDEEEATDQALTELATSVINLEAEEEGREEEEEYA
jgi:ferritin-like metal-binding protein YciE